MNAKLLRLLVVAFGVGTLGSLALAPNVSYGLDTSTESNQRATQRVGQQNEYNDGYNRGFEQGRMEEQTRIDNEQFNNQNGNACCGGQQQPQQSGGRR